MIQAIAVADGDCARAELDQPALSPQTRAALPLDLELIEGLNSRSEAGFRRFYQQFATVLHSMIWSILRDQKEAEDALQETFVQMWKQSSRYDPARSSLFSWAVTIARSRAIDRVRRHQRSHRNHEAAVAAAEDAAFRFEPAADDKAIQNEVGTRVRTLVESLPGPQREAIQLAFFGAMTQSEISNVLGIPLGTVKARIRRGLITLRELLAGPRTQDGLG